MEGHSEAAITIDAGTAPEGGYIGGGAAHAEDAEGAPAGAGGTAEVRPVPVALSPWASLMPPGPSTGWQGEAHNALGPHPI